MLKMIKNEGIGEYSRFLQGVASGTGKKDVCYGRQGLILFYLYKYKAYALPEDYEFYNLLIEECVGSLAEGNDVVAVTEFLFIYRLYREDFEAEYDLSEIVEAFEQLVYSHFRGCIARDNFDGYSGAGYPMRYFLLKQELPDGLLGSFREYISRNIVPGAAGGHYIRLTASSHDNDLGITHGLSFIVTTYLHLYKLGCLAGEDLLLLEEFVRYLKANYKDYLNTEQASNIVYGKLGLLYTLIFYQTLFRDRAINGMIQEIFASLSENRESICRTNKDSLLYGNTGIILFYHAIRDHIPAGFREDLLFWNSRLPGIVQSGNSDFSLAEGKTGHYLAAMAIHVNNFSFMNLFFINTL